MKTTLIVGSHREDSQSSKVGKYIEQYLGSSEHEVNIIDLKENPFPLWGEDNWKEGSEVSQIWQPYSEQLSSSDGFVIISPEWSGMVPAGLKNFFLFCGNGELANKPGLLVGVSAGRGGSYPIVELRMSSYKNTQICYLPAHVIVRDVKDVLNSNELNESDKGDFYIKKRLNHSLDLLLDYEKALSRMRKETSLDLKEYPNGM